MSVMPFDQTPREYINVNPRKENTDLVNSPEVDLATWLKQVCYFSQAASGESQNSLIELAHNLPPLNDQDPEVKPVLKAIEAFAKEKKFDPTLSPKSFTALCSLSRRMKKPVEQKLFE